MKYIRVLNKEKTAEIVTSSRRWKGDGIISTDIHTYIYTHIHVYIHTHTYTKDYLHGETEERERV